MAASWTTRWNLDGLAIPPSGRARLFAPRRRGGGSTPGVHHFLCLGDGGIELPVCSGRQLLGRALGERLVGRDAVLVRRLVRYRPEDQRVRDVEHVAVREL